MGFRKGDAAALERVFRAYAPYVVSIVRRGYSTPHGGTVQGVMDVETQHDLLQEVFVRVLSPALREKYDGLRPYAAFLRAVVGNVMLENARRQSNALARFTSADTDEQFAQRAEGWTPQDPLPDEAVLVLEDREMVREYLGGLSENERHFVQVRFHDGESQRDAAEMLGLGRQVVRTMERKVRDDFKAFVGRWRRKRTDSTNPGT
jgi:RNA polymerase sigma-70 factor (ECF subfamily)